MDEVFVVTGAARGIGRAIALRLLQDGGRVAVMDVDEGALADLAQSAGAKARVMTLHADVADEQQVAKAMAEVVDAYGRLDGLVNNAAIAKAETGPVEKLEYKAWRRMLANNLDSAFLCTKHAVAELRRAGGAIVNIASTRALQSEPHTEAYAASKGALVAMTHALAISLGPTVRVNAISPGWIDTQAFQPGASPSKLREIDHAQHPSGRVGMPEDVAQLTAYLLSDRAGFITGQNFVIDGGMTKKMIYVE